MTYNNHGSESYPSDMQIMHTKLRKKVRTPPPGTMLFEILQPVEQELYSRGLLGAPHPHTTPLWFLAETERNVFLWRRGHSIADHSRYSFWVDLHALIVKRKAQLRRSRGCNPFVGCGTPEPHYAAVQECEYLELFEDAAHSIIHYASAVSLASYDILSASNPQRSLREIVILPSGVNLNYNSSSKD